MGSNWPYIYEQGPWRFVWNGGRLADVFHLESDSAQDAVQVGKYDWTTGKHTHAGYRSLESAARRWIEDCGVSFERNLA